MLGSRITAVVVTCALFVACSGGADGTGGGSSTDGGASGGTGDGTGTGTGGGTGGGGGSGSGSATCPARALEALTEGCTMTLRTPEDCATITFPAEFAWEADACHTPYYLQIAGTPVDENNYTSITVNTEPINALSWAEPVNAKALEGLTTTDGFYHWRVCNAYETGCSATRSFRVKE